MSKYNFFTHYYDDIVRGEGYSLYDEVDMLDQFINDYGKFKDKPVSILELACGTGVVAKELLMKGYNIYGMDISEEMLSKAEDNIGYDRCILGDMVKFDLDKEFDVILCNYNSICHLLCFESWQKLFMQVMKHLKKGGLFIFDINTLNEFEHIAKDFRSYYRFFDKETSKTDIVCLEMEKKEFKDKAIHRVHVPKGYFYNWIIRIFKENESSNYDLIEENIEENSFEIDKIVNELKSFGFKILRLEDFHKGEIDEDSQRVYFVAQKI